MWLNRQYVFPTREAFRYHFEEPPAAPLQHEEIKRIRRIMQWDKPQYRNSRDFNPMKSERTELDYQMAPEIIRKDAPFGTESTPTITMKIIGGRQVPVIEKHATVNNDFAGSRIQPLRPIADKPNHLDPRIHGDNPGGYYHKDVQDYFGAQGSFYDDPTNVVNKRPDSKDIVRGQLKALPPIQQNRTRNDLSTVFEAEPWTGDRNPPLADETEYKQNYFLGRDFEKGMENYHNSGPKEFHHVSVNEKYELSKLLRGDVLLPTDPIALSDSQKLTLSKLVCNDLNRFEPNELRDVYLECSQHDKDLRGFCPIEVLDNSLRRHKAYISDLRLIAAQYVDPNYPGKVNYERVLSFIGSVLQANAKGHLEKILSPRKQEVAVDTNIENEKRSQERQPKYYMQNGESFHTGSIYHDRQVAKLLRMVEQELSKNTYTFDWTRWQNSFFERDRDHRNTLSAAQIKDICYDHKLPLSESLLNRILELCEDNNRDGQYKWSSFMEFLGRVRPSNTGLPMPVSKRPLEYAKHFPEPVPNWPRTDTDTERRSTSPRRDISPRRGDNRPDEREASSPDRERYRSRDRTPPRLSYQDRSPLPNLRLSSPSPSHKSQSSSPRDKYSYHQYQQGENYPNMGNNNTYNRQERERNYYDRNDEYDPENEYRRPRRMFNDDQKCNHYGYDRRRNYADDPSGYQPSWQQNAQRRSTSPPPARRANDRDSFRRDERFSQDQYFGTSPRSPSRLQTPLRRNRSVSPVRHMSPVRGQSLPNTYREPYDDRPFRDYYKEQYPYQYEYMEAPNNRYTERDNYQQRDGMGYQQRDGMNSYRDGYRPGRGGGRDYDSPRNREQKIMQLSQQLHNLETQYEIARDGVSSSEKPWLDRYIKMAQALYNSDISNRGSLPRNDVIEIVNQYNNAFNLNLDMTRAHMLAIAPENLDKSGNIMLRPFLASLSSERISYKP